MRSQGWPDPGHIDRCLGEGCSYAAGQLVRIFAISGVRYSRIHKSRETPGEFVEALHGLGPCAGYASQRQMAGPHGEQGLHSQDGAQHSLGFADAATSCHVLKGINQEQNMRSRNGPAHRFGHLSQTGFPDNICLISSFFSIL